LLVVAGYSTSGDNRLRRVVIFSDIMMAYN